MHRSSPATWIYCEIYVLKYAEHFVDKYNRISGRNNFMQRSDSLKFSQDWVYIYLVRKYLSEVIEELVVYV